MNGTTGVESETTGKGSLFWTEVPMDGTKSTVRSCEIILLKVYSYENGGQRQMSKMEPVCQI